MPESTNPAADSAANTDHSFRRAKRTVLFGIVAVVVGLVLFIVWREMYGEKFTISPETTYITEPLREDGLPDYAAALDAMASVGVTPENNAAVLYWQAFGPEVFRPDQRDEFFGKLGIPVPPQSGGYLLIHTEYAVEQPLGSESSPGDGSESASGSPEAISEFRDRLDLAATMPWSAANDPELAEWIRQNEQPLALIIEGTKRPRYFMPVLIEPVEPDDPPMLMFGLLPWGSLAREASRALTARAMLRLHDGDLAGAQDDLMACHRLARHVAEGHSLVEWLIGIAIDSMAWRADASVALYGGLSSTQAMAYRTRLAEIPALPSCSKKIDRSERFAYLDTVQTVAWHGQGVLEILASYDPDRRIPSILVDWNIPLYRANQWFDRLTAVAETSDRAKRRKKVDEIKQRLNAIDGAARDSSRAITDRSGLAADMLLAQLSPAVLGVMDAADRARMNSDLVQLAFALAAYRADHGSYPATLGELAPRYVDAIPDDVFSGNPPIYRSEPDDIGYLLYSVGANATDDRGRSQDEHPDADDIAIRTPQAEATP